MVPVKAEVVEEVKRDLRGAGVPLKGLRLGPFVDLLAIRQLRPGEDSEVWDRFETSPLRKERLRFDGSAEAKITLGLGIIAQGEIFKSGFDINDVERQRGRRG